MKQRKRCKECGKKLPKRKRRNSVFCDDACRNDYHNPRNIGKWRIEYNALLDHFSLIYLRMLAKEQPKRRRIC